MENLLRPGFMFVQHLCVFRAIVPFLKIAFYPRLHKCHRRSQIFPVPFADFASSGVLVSFITFIFAAKWPCLALRGRPQPLKKPSQCQKGQVSKKMNVINDTKTPELAKSAKETGNICDFLWHLSRRLD